MTCIVDKDDVPLIPRYSLRALLVLTTGFGLFFFVVSLGLRGHIWAFALSLAIGFVGVAFVVYAVFFAIVWVISLGTGKASPMVASLSVADQQTPANGDAVTPDPAGNDEGATT